MVEAPDQRIQPYIKFLQDEIPAMIDAEDYRNADALKTINDKFIELVEDNPQAMAEAAARRGRTISEMSRVEVGDVFEMYSQFMDKKARQKVDGGSAGDKAVATIIHDNIVDIAKNIRDYPNIQAAVALDLSGNQYYREDVWSFH